MDQLGCPHLLPKAGLRRRCCWAPAPAEVDRYVLPVGRSAANPPHATPQQMSNDGTERQTDRQTNGRKHDRYMDPASHSVWEVSAEQVT